MIYVCGRAQARQTQQFLHELDDEEASTSESSSFEATSTNIRRDERSRLVPDSGKSCLRRRQLQYLNVA